MSMGRHVRSVRTARAETAWTAFAVTLPAKVSVKLATFQARSAPVAPYPREDLLAAAEWRARPMDPFAEERATEPRGIPAATPRPENADPAPAMMGSRPSPLPATVLAPVPSCRSRTAGPLSATALARSAMVRVPPIQTLVQQMNTARRVSASLCAKAESRAVPTPSAKVETVWTASAATPHAPSNAALATCPALWGPALQ
jgi:hypothetical protein